MSKEEIFHEAVQCYLKRKCREEHPHGNFDKAGRWTPNVDEQKDCCSFIRTPSRNWPHTLLSHCRSADHIANVFAVDVAELRRRIRKANKMGSADILASAI